MNKIIHQATKNSVVFICSLATYGERRKVRENENTHSSLMDDFI